jgi:hypothetical protein
METGWFESAKCPVHAGTCGPASRETESIDPQEKHALPGIAIKLAYPHPCEKIPPTCVSNWLRHAPVRRRIVERRDRWHGLARRKDLVPMPNRWLSWLSGRIEKSAGTETHDTKVSPKHGSFQRWPLRGYPRTHRISFPMSQRASGLGNQHHGITPSLTTRIQSTICSQGNDRYPGKRGMNRRRHPAPSSPKESC